jgi:hypothetical protein
VVKPGPTASTACAGTVDLQVTGKWPREIAARRRRYPGRVRASPRGGGYPGCHIGVGASRRGSSASARLSHVGAIGRVRRSCRWSTRMTLAWPPRPGTTEPGEVSTAQDTHLLAGSGWGGGAAAGGRSVSGEGITALRSHLHHRGDGSEVNFNIYPSKDAVYLDGAPRAGRTADWGRAGRWRLRLPGHSPSGKRARYHAHRSARRHGCQVVLLGAIASDLPRGARRGRRTGNALHHR